MSQLNEGFSQSAYAKQEELTKQGAVNQAYARSYLPQARHPFVDEHHDNDLKQKIEQLICRLQQVPTKPIGSVSIDLNFDREHGWVAHYRESMAF